MKVSWSFVRRSGPFFVCALTFLLLNAAIVVKASSMYPVSRGSSADFWYSMYYVKFHEQGFLGGVYPMRGSSCIYYHQGFHGEFLYSVPVAEVQRLLPEVRKRISEGGGHISDEERELLSSDPDIGKLVETRLKVEALEATKRGDGEYHHASQKMFRDRWNRIRRYWANILFEVVFFNALLISLWYPFFKLGRHLWRAVSIGTALPVLFVPYYLGYCTWTFTSTGPIGGALYPWTLHGLRKWGLDWNGLDDRFVAILPSPLEFLTQTQGPMLSVSGMGAVSPTSLLIIGVFLGLVTYISSRGLAKLFPPTNPLPGQSKEESAECVKA